MTMLFSNSSPKVLKSGILGPKLRHFCFFVNFRKQTKLWVLISNMTIVFLKFLPKNTQGRHFLSQIQAFSLFQDILQLDKFEGADFKLDNIFFQIPAQKYPNHTFLVQNLDFFFSSQNLQLDKSEGVDFKYDNSFFQPPAQKYQNKAFLARHLTIFIFALNFATRQIQGP